MTAEYTPSKTAVVFPGQGSNILGAGRALIDVWPEARDRLELYSLLADMDIEELLVRESPPSKNGPPPLQTADDLVQTHLAMVSYGILAYEWLTTIAHVTPDVIAGHSLGEITALACAKVISPEDALVLARARGRLMANACKGTPGAMTAFMGRNLNDIRRGISEWQKSRTTTPDIFEANINGFEQLVVSGDITDLNQLEPFLACIGIKAKRLHVAGAFHSPFMRGAGEKLFKVARQLHFKPSEIPVISSVTGRGLTKIKSLPVTLSLQLIKPVEWFCVMERMAKAQIGSLIEVSGSRPVLIPLAAKHPNWHVRCIDTRTLLIEQKGAKN